MALVFESWWSEFYFTVFFLLFLYYVYFKMSASKFWESKNVSHLPPVFLLGNAWNASITKNFALILADFYKERKRQKLVGFWNFSTPAVLLADLDIIKNVLTRDFNHFRDRGFPIDFDHDPLAANLFNVGGVKWRNLRVKLTPTFTSGKMKMMFPTMVECGNELKEYLKKTADDPKGIEAKEVLARFTTDIISSCAFGIETNSLKNPNSEFRKYGKKIFEPSLPTFITGILINFSPVLFKLMKLRFTPKDVSDFFMNAVRETIEYREKNNVKRNDFMELLIQLKNKGKLEDVDGTVPASPDPHADYKRADDTKFSFDEAAAQAFVFFAAGFETSSTTLTFALYELAVNGDVQNRLQDEIDRTVKKHEGKITYGGIMEMEYLDWVIQETLRKYPPVPFLFRQCNKDYEIPELNAEIPNKVTVMIPVFAIQRDPEYFPDPEKFDPNRYSPEEKAKRHHFASLPFGEGPRNCIGNRFGLLQTKVGLVSVLSELSVQMTVETPIPPLSFDKRSFVLASDRRIPLRFVRRE